MKLQEITLKILNNENIGELNEHELNKIQQILIALVSSGGLTGVKGGKTIIHFDAYGEFMGIELDYWPWRKRRK